MDTIPMLSAVGMLCFFIFFVFGILAVQVPYGKVLMAASECCCAFSFSWGSCISAASIQVSCGTPPDMESPTSRQTTETVKTHTSVPPALGTKALDWQHVSILR